MDALTVPSNQWVHVAATVSGTSGITFYLNGVVAGSNGNTANNNTGLGNNGVEDPYGMVGNYGRAQDQWWPGNVDEIRVYDTVLDQPAIAALMDTPNSLPPVISVQPQDQTLLIGDAGAVLTYGAAVAGTPPFSYQWQEDSVDIPGATNDTLVISNATPAEGACPEQGVCVAGRDPGGDACPGERVE